MSFIFLLFGSTGITCWSLGCRPEAIRWQLRFSALNSALCSHPSSLKCSQTRATWSGNKQVLDGHWKKTPIGFLLNILVDLWRTPSWFLASVLSLCCSFVPRGPILVFHRWSGVLSVNTASVSGTAALKTESGPIRDSRRRQRFKTMMMSAGTVSSSPQNHV